MHSFSLVAVLQKANKQNLIIKSGLLDNQVINSEVSIGRWLAIALTFVLSIGLLSLGIYLLPESDPYVQTVLKLTGDPIQGHAIFQMNCSGCHGLEARGRVGPSLQGVSQHKSQKSLIYQVTSGNTPPMPQFQPSPQEMADLLTYLEML